MQRISTEIYPDGTVKDTFDYTKEKKWVIEFNDMNERKKQLEYYTIKDERDGICLCFRKNKVVMKKVFLEDKCLTSSKYNMNRYKIMKDKVLLYKNKVQFFY